jgi:hypothetical protein
MSAIAQKISGSERATEYAMTCTNGNTLAASAQQTKRFTGAILCKTEPLLTENPV